MEMNEIHTEIGEIFSVSGNNITVQLFDTIKSNIPIIDGVMYRVGQVGSFLRVPLGYTNLFGIVTRIGADAIPENMRNAIQSDYSTIRNRQWLSIVLVGEQTGKSFQRGVFQSPTTGDKVHLVTIRDLNIIYGGYEKNNSISVGNISASSSLDARIDLDKMVARHCAILGSTGSGKSNAVGVILKEISNRNFKSSRILLIDPHGEYNHVFKDSNLYKIRPESEEEKPFYVPFWALPFNELIGIFPGHLNDQQQDYIREKIKTAKVNVVNKYNEDFKRVEINLVTADTPIPFSIKKLWYELDDFERQTYKVRGNPDTKNLRATGNVDRMVSNEYEPAGVGSSPPFFEQSK